MIHRGMLKHQLMKLYLICYMAYRFVTEFLRPEIPLAGGLTGYQWATLLLIPLFAFLWYRDAQWLKAHRTGHNLETTTKPEPVDQPSRHAT